MSETKLETLAKLLRESPDEVFIQPHNVPDPDAIASSLGLQYLLEQKGIETKIVYDMNIEKVNSLKMMELFKVPMIQAKDALTLGVEDWAVLVDAQKGNSNITDLATDEVAVIDQLEYMGNRGYHFEDIRPEVGSCSAIIAGYFFENNIAPPKLLATALFYGIIMDTNNLTRGASQFDIDMFYKVWGLADKDLIVELSGNEISREDLAQYADAFRSVEIYDELGFLRLDSANNSLLGAAGDIVASIEGVNVVVAYSTGKNGVKLSVRSITPRIKANELAASLVHGIGVGGGHHHMAGGFIPAEKLSPVRSIDTFLRYRAINYHESCAKN
jgi:nanoRNase/pAp phosphatase (c-di-AMP/oligoRNAs hydrolase)